MQLMIKDDSNKTQTLISQAEDRSVVKLSPKEQRIWLEDLGDVLEAWGNLADYSTMQEAEILYHAWLVWESLDPKDRLHPDALTPWNGSFYSWASAYMKSRSGGSAAETVQNKIRVYRKWKSPEATIKIPEVVYIPKRQEGHIPVRDPKDCDDWEPVETDIRTVDYSKLLVATASAEKGLAPEVWSAIFDPQASVADVQRALREDSARNGNGSDPLRFFCENGIIYVRENGLVEGLAMFLSEEQTSPLFTMGAEHLLKAVGIKGNPFTLTEVTESIKALAWAAGEDEVILSSRDGYRLGSFNRQEASELYRILGEFLQ